MWGRVPLSVASCSRATLPAWIIGISLGIMRGSSPAMREPFLLAIGPCEIPRALPGALVQASLAHALKCVVPGMVRAGAGSFRGLGSRAGKARWSLTLVASLSRLALPARRSGARPAFAVQAGLIARCAVSRRIEPARAFFWTLFAWWCAAMKRRWGVVVLLAVFVRSPFVRAAFISLLIGWPGALKAWRGAFLARVPRRRGSGARAIIRVLASCAVFPRAVNGIAAESWARGSGRLLFAISARRWSARGWSPIILPPITKISGHGFLSKNGGCGFSG
jgi:hypothetical protein